MRIGIAGNKGIQAIINTLYARLLDISPAPLIEPVDDKAYDLIVVSGLRPDGKPGMFGCPALLLNSDIKGITQAVGSEARLVVTYGLNKKACVTASSIADSACTICVQRAFAALSGATVCQREFGFSTGPYGPEAALAAASVLLILGFL